METGIATMYLLQWLQSIPSQMTPGSSPSPPQSSRRYNPVTILERYGWWIFIADSHVSWQRVSGAPAGRSELSDGRWGARDPEGDREWAKEKLRNLQKETESTAPEWESRDKQEPSWRPRSPPPLSMVPPQPTWRVPSFRLFWILHVLSGFWLGCNKFIFIPGMIANLVSRILATWTAGATTSALVNSRLQFFSSNSQSQLFKI